MSDLTTLEKRQFERLLQMGGGYVLDFSNRTFAEFVSDSVGRDIYDARYAFGSGSKANLLRGFWKEESNRTIGKLLGDLVEYAVAEGQVGPDRQADLQGCRRAVTRLMQECSVPELDALSAISEERDFEAVAKAVRDAIERNQPETALDRLHTFVIKYVRSLCAAQGIDVPRDKPLHSLFGEYLKRLREAGLVESEMTSRILKSSISVLEAFNDVRNNRSLAHVSRGWRAIRGSIPSATSRGSATCSGKPRHATAPLRTRLRLLPVIASSVSSGFEPLRRSRVEPWREPTGRRP